MSDGGAAAIVEGVSMLARFKLGRVVLWLLAAHIAFTGITGGGRDRAFYLFIALGLALTALGFGFVLARRARKERAQLRQFFLFIGFVLVSMIAAVVLVFRKRSTGPVLPPSEEEINALSAGES